MYVLDYLIYHLRPYGIVGQAQPLPDKLSFAEMIGDTSASDKTKISQNANDNSVANADDTDQQVEAAVSEID